MDDENITARALNRDLEKINLWAWQWKMQFNANKTEEVIFSCKRQKPNHPNLRLGNDAIASKNEHKHLGLILDSKLDFQSHIREAILKARRGIGMIKCLSKYVCREALEQIYKLYVRPHLDYGDIIYHKHDPEMHLHFTQKLEQTQYSAALAVTGAWRGTSRQKLYNELGWETLYHRRWYRRLCHFYSLCKSKAPAYLYSEIPQQRNLVYNLRNPHCYEQPTGRTIRYSNSYFHNTISEWDLLDNKVRNSSSISQFKKNLLGIIRPSKNPTYNIRDILGIRLLTKLRVEFSALNGHRFKHNFVCLSPMCVCGTGTEDNEHFLLHCPLYSILRQDLFDQLSDIDGFNAADVNPKELCLLLLFGDQNLGTVANRIILEANISFIKASARLNQCRNVAAAPPSFRSN